MTAPQVSATDRPYQLLPRLDDDQLRLLRDSIAKNGVLEPVVFDEDGEILDGHHRVEIAEDLGVEYPRRVIEGLSDEDKQKYALTTNLARRQLTAANRSAHVMRLRQLGMSIRSIAKETGIPRETVRRDVSGDPDGSPDEITGADNKTYAARPAATAEDLRDRILKRLPESPDKALTVIAMARAVGAKTEQVREILTALVAEGLAVHRYQAGAENAGRYRLNVPDEDTQTPEPSAADPASPVDGSGSSHPDGSPGEAQSAGLPSVSGTTEESQGGLADAEAADDLPGDEADPVAAAEQRDARALLARAVDLLASPNRPGDFVEHWIKQMGPYDDELSELVKRAADAIAVLDQVIEEVGR